MKAPISKALVKPDPLNIKAAQIFDFKHLQSAAIPPKSLIYNKNNGHHTTTAKIPTHNMRPPPFFKPLSNLGIGDPTMLAG